MNADYGAYMTIAARRPIRKAVFPVAGLGSRFLPATKVLPKEMLPIVDKPLIQYAVEEAIAAGIEHIIFITHRAKRAIEDHFDQAHELQSLLAVKGKSGLLLEIGRSGAPIHYSSVRQAEPLGLGHAVLCARPLIGEEPFAVILPDDLMDAPHPVLAQMIECYMSAPASLVAVEQIKPEDTKKYGVVDVEPEAGAAARISRIVEKPSADQAPSLMGVVGRYILTPTIFSKLARIGAGSGGEIQLTDAIAELLDEEPVRAFRFEGERFDCGSKLGYLAATVNFGLKHPEIGESFATLLAQRQSAPDEIPLQRFAAATAVELRTV
jgi:UTP--glucose-1-phosphate uridylyltransferase